MAKLFSIFNRRENVYQPIFTRSRQQYNAPISSEKLNLLNDQFVVDVARLGSHTDDLSSKIDEANQLNFMNLESSTPGYYYSDDILMTIYRQRITFNSNTEDYDLESSTPYYQDSIEFYSPAINSSKISNLFSKIYDLEKTINIE